MGCPPVRGDNPRALASGFSYVQVDIHDISILYHLHQCRPCTSRDILWSSLSGWYIEDIQMFLLNMPFISIFLYIFFYIFTAVKYMFYT